MTATPVATLVRLASRPRANLLSTVTLALLSLVGATELALVVLFGWVLALELGDGGGAAVDALASAVDGVFVVLPWVSAAAWLSFLAWQFLTVRRVHRLGMGEDLMPPSAGLFFTLSLVPYGVIKQLHSAVAPGDGSRRGRLLGVWWASWLTTLVLLVAGGRLMDSDLAIVDDQRVLSLLGLSTSLGLTAMVGLTAWVVHVISRASSRLDLPASLPGQGDAARVAGPGDAIEGADPAIASV
jgi:hypothetical protein